MRLPFDQQPQKLMQMYLTKMSEQDPDRFPRPPQLPFWARPRGGMMRPADDQRQGDGAGSRRGAATRKNAIERQKSQKADPE